MGNYTEYSYIAYLGINTPPEVIDNLVLASENVNKPYGKEHIFTGKFEFLNKVDIAHFCREKRFLVVDGVSKYYRDKKEIEAFISWVDQYVNTLLTSDYRGLIYYDLGESPPDLIYRDKVISVKEAIEMHDR